MAEDCCLCPFTRLCKCVCRLHACVGYTRGHLHNRAFLWISYEFSYEGFPMNFTFPRPSSLQQSNLPILWINKDIEKLLMQLERGHFRTSISNFVLFLFLKLQLVINSFMQFSHGWLFRKIYWWLFSKTVLKIIKIYNLNPKMPHWWGVKFRALKSHEQWVSWPQCHTVYLHENV